MIRVGIVGASGYTGGETLRILLRHPQVQIVQATSESNAGHYLYAIHPNLRKQCALKFTTIGELKPCDVLFLCLPHGSAMRRIGALEAMAKTIIDLSADFRLRNADDYPASKAETWITETQGRAVKEFVESGGGFYALLLLGHSAYRIAILGARSVT